jgi:uncharacterized RDD family membrane protein YckC
VNVPPEIVSGEGVGLDLAHAGVGSRLVAAAIDVALQIVAGIVLVLITSDLASGTDSAAFAAVIVVELVLVVAGYPILMEWLNRGRTVGKLAMGLRVVRDDGGPIGFRQALVRGLAGLVLEKPGIAFPLTTAAGLLTMIFSAREKRIGDMMAGTFVLNERAGPQRAVAPQQFAVPYHLQAWAQTLDLSRLDDQLALAVRQFLMRAGELTPAAQVSLGESLRAQLEAVISPPAPPGTPTPWLLTTVLAERRRRSEPAASGPYPAAPASAPAPAPSTQSARSPQSPQSPFAPPS